MKSSFCGSRKKVFFSGPITERGDKGLATKKNLFFEALKTQVKTLVAGPLKKTFFAASLSG